MKIVDKAYQGLVNQDPDIRRKYQEYRKKVYGVKRLLAWGYLLRLNLQRLLLPGEGGQGELYEGKTLRFREPESAAAALCPPKELAERLASFDAVSFDVFDTLLFRPFERPSDLFFKLSERFGYMDLERIRREMEERARREKQKREGNGEVTLEEIWTVMERETGIPKEEGMREEWECEKKYCFANPYMRQVIGYLKKQEKRILLISDMYLRENQIRELLRLCGYGDFSECFVSCEYGKSKNAGDLYQEVRRQLGSSKSCVHVGDHPFSDGVQAKKQGFAVFPYRNVNELGRPRRAEDMSRITGSIYRGLVNARLYNGLEAYSLAYEFGYVYGGLFALGYCRWIHRKAKEKKADKILFLSRDGDVLSKVYARLYPKEENWSYVYWSRLAAAKLTAGDFKYDYFRRFLYHKVDQGYSLEDIFRHMELEDMLEGFLSEKGYAKTKVLTEKKAEEVKSYLMENWETLLEHYKEQSLYGKNYYGKILKGCKTAVAVDVGWAGSGAVALDHMVRKVWKLDCRILGLVAGTNTVHNQEPDASEAFLSCGSLESYMFSQSHNRDLWKLHDPGKAHNVIVELLLASETGSFRGFQKTGPVFSPREKGIDSKQIQRGILDFTEDFLTKGRELPDISGRDAYGPIKLLLENEKQVSRALHTETFQMNLE